MISFPTTPTGEVRRGEEKAHKQHPHPHLLRGVGVWCGGRKAENAGGENPAAVGPSLPKIQDGYRRGAFA